MDDDDSGQDFTADIADVNFVSEVSKIERN